MSAHLLAFDSVHGRWPVPTGARDGAILIAQERLGYTRAASPAEIDWGALGIDIVLECSGRSEEHTSELQSLMRISYAVFCLKKKKQQLAKQHEHQASRI